MNRSGPSALIAVFFLGALSGTTGAQTAPVSDAPVAVVTLEECVMAARITGPGLALAGLTQDAARSALAQARATSGLTLGETADYFHRGKLPGFVCSELDGHGGWDPIRFRQ